MILLDETSRQIHEHAVAKAAGYLVAEAELLSAIIEVDRARLYEKFGETYLTPYCVKYLNLSEDVAPIFVRVARKSLQVPELELAVQEGLQITKAKTIASVIDQGNKGEWIEKARILSKEKLEREVAAVNPSAVRSEKAKPTGPDRVRVEFEVSFEDAEVLKRARELMSQKKSKHAQIGETYVTALRDWVEREDPVRKAERAEERKKQKAVRVEKPKTQRSRDHSGSPGHVLHQVHLRDRGGCRKRMPDGSNCGCKQWTEIHHIAPKAYGGADTLENLITLCHAHHRKIHERSVTAHRRRESRASASAVWSFER
jgi:hypothetical protein